MSLVRTETGKLSTENCNSGNGKVGLDLTFPKLVAVNTVMFSWFYGERKEGLHDVYIISPADRSGRR